MIDSLHITITNVLLIALPLGIRSALGPQLEGVHKQLRTWLYRLSTRRPFASGQSPSDHCGWLPMQP